MSGAALRRWKIIAATSAVLVAGAAVEYAREASALAQQVQEAREAGEVGRCASVRQRCHAAASHASSAIHAAQSRLQRGLLRYWQRPALRMAGLANADELAELAARIQFQCAVVRLHGASMGEGLDLLDDAVAMRTALAAKAAGDELACEGIHHCPTVLWGSGLQVRQRYKALLQEEAAHPRCFSLRVLTNFAWLWYATGFDEDAMRLFRQCAALADELLGAHAALVAGVASSTTALEALVKAGTGQHLPPPLPREAQRLLDKVQFGVVEVDGQAPAEASESVKRTWRKRITARINLMQVLTTTSAPMPQDVYKVLLELCCGATGGRPVIAPPLHVPYTSLDHHWLVEGGMSRIATGVGAALTDLLWCGAVPTPYADQIRELAGQAFDLARERAHHSSATRQGILQYHFTKHLCLQKDAASLERAARHIAQAAVNHRAAAGQSFIHHDLRLEAEARLLQMVLDHPLIHSPAAPVSRVADLVLQPRAIRRLLDRTRADADHPVMVRAAMARCTTSDAAGVVGQWAAIRGHSDWCMSTAEAQQLCNAVEAAIRLLATVSVPP